MRVVIDSELDEYVHLHKKQLDGILSLTDKRRYEELGKKLYSVERAPVSGKKFDPD